MTDLQMSLIGIAGVFVAGVFGYNKIQEYKAKKSVERAFSTDHDDVLMRTGDAPAARHEPSFSLDSAAPGVAGGEASAAAAAL
ncbi:cell division protein, partial [Rugamonas sp. FT82W]|nr:cell division protein [Duganella vulcania]